MRSRIFALALAVALCAASAMSMAGCGSPDAVNMKSHAPSPANESGSSGIADAKTGDGSGGAGEEPGSVGTADDDAGEEPGSAGTADDDAGPGYATADPSGAAQEPVELVVQYPYIGKIPKDLALIEDAVNARVGPKLGVRISLHPVSSSNLRTETEMMHSLGEKLDLVMCGFNTPLGDYVSQGILIELDGLIAEHGQAILTAAGITMSGGYFGDKLYAAPSEEKHGRVRALYCREDILAKHGITPQAGHVYTMEEIGDIFATVRAGEPEGFYCLATGVSNNASIYGNFRIMDTMGSSLASGCLPGFGQDGSKVINYFATDDYEDACREIRDWYLNGYLNPECNTITDAVMSQMQSGAYFSYFASAEPDMLASQPRVLEGYLGAGVVPLYTCVPHAVTQNFRVSMWGISSSCAYPEKAMQWLNELWSDQGLSMLLTYGIEGIHYEFAEGGPPVIRYPDGVDGSTARYQSMLSVWGDKSKLYLMAPLDAGHHRNMADFNASIAPEHKSRALGYSFDFTAAEGVEDKYANVLAVIETYANSLNLGVLDLDAALPQFRASLAAAGIDAVISENQRQYDAWLSAAMDG